MKPLTELIAEAKQKLLDIGADPDNYWVTVSHMSELHERLAIMGYVEWFVRNDGVVFMRMAGAPIPSAPPPGWDESVHGKWPGEFAKLAGPSH